jgi:hypothetical protein
MSHFIVQAGFMSEHGAPWGARHIAVLEVEDGVTSVSAIRAGAKGVIRIVKQWVLHRQSMDGDAEALLAAHQECNELNGSGGRP